MTMRQIKCLESVMEGDSTLCRVAVTIDADCDDVACATIVRETHIYILNTLLCIFDLPMLDSDTHDLLNEAANIQGDGSAR